MAKTIDAVRGMNDLLPEDTAYWQYLEQICSEIMQNYDYREIRLPILESTSLFKRTIGDVTDIIEKEMYTFEDRNGESMSMRPEGTAGCVRAGIQRGLLHNQQQRLWYTGPMFRYEKPQKGRYRQFYQLGVEAFGFADPVVDAEQIIMMYRLWERLGLTDKIKLKLNNLGDLASRQRYREVLVAYCRERFDELDADSQRRLESNPLRILDSKNPAMAKLISEAPSLEDYVDDASREHSAVLQKLLLAAGVEFELNPRLVRGLDYYCSTVYEWVTDDLGAQGTVCAGGRYDGLVEQLGGRATSAVGFALGLERVVLLLQKLAEEENKKSFFDVVPDVYVVFLAKEKQERGLKVIETVREKWPNLRIRMGSPSKSRKSQLKQAKDSGAECTITLHDDLTIEGLEKLNDFGEGRERA